MRRVERPQLTGLRQRYGPSIAYLVAWILFSVVGVWIVLQLRVVLLLLAFHEKVDMFALESVDKFGLVIFALLWVIGVGIVEAYLRQGLNKRRLRARILRITCLEAGLLGFAYVMQFSLR